MTSQQIRQQFLDFFASQKHQIVSSAPMVIKGDPTLMFTNAGMNPFKDIFLGNAPVVHPRIANTQKCLRVSGKHNDLEEVGVDTYHHTMFEMLGNWSFGDYFKEEAIQWAWILLTEVYKIPKDQLYVTVFEGDEKENLAFDQESYDIWKKYIAEDRILKGNKKDNFWEMGDMGPCGPCSEIHADIRSSEDRAAVDGRTLVNNDHPQVIEIWNNVFMQFNRKADGSLELLPHKHVDTGMGFERLCMVLQRKQSNYDTDVFTPLIQKIESLSGIAYTATAEKKDVAMRVIADHVRAVSFAIADGQLPSSSGAGYVIRRILRRAVRYGYSFLNFRHSFIHQVFQVLEHQMGSAFPELTKNKNLIGQVIKEEEESFLRTLEKGIELLDQVIQKTEGETISGAIAFELYDTFGFPIDLTQLIASENEKEVNITEFETHLQAQKERSRAATKLETDDWVELKSGDTQFVGYDQMEAETSILRYRRIKAKGKEMFQLVLETTPFYAEGGGQVGDHGTLMIGEDKIGVVDVKKENGLIVHFTEELPQQPDKKVWAKVCADWRTNTTSHHSATHLLHEALREVLGTHVEQKGSLVNPEYLRFDFSHFSKVNEEELAKIENLVNARIQANHPLIENREATIEEAKASGAMMLFGEKYGDRVRMIQFGNSIELCGGTHVTSTGAIKKFKLQSEGAVAAGIRRIEAIAGHVAEEWIQGELNSLEEARLLLKTKDVSKGIRDLQTKLNDAQKHIEELMRAQAMQIKSEWKNEIKAINGRNLLFIETALDAASIKDICFQLKAEYPSFGAVITTQGDAKPMITIAFSDDAVQAWNCHAGQLVKEWSKDIKGGGGGQPSFATCGGTDASGLKVVMEKAKALLTA
ncbi:MAG: alanine--tRNA ligase [Bacteroidetes bacterium]|nr:alanine--tRNA ligase [Bacteroidota bacterium]